MIKITQRFDNKIITPEIAAEMLTHNYEGNRNIREAYVRQLAHVMRQGRYISQNGQTIVFGIDDGILYDGQHRLAAIVKSEVPQAFGVAYIRDGKEAYKTIDNGTRRQAADFLHVPNKTNCAAVGKVMSCIEWGNAPLLSCLQGKWDPKTQVDRGIVVTYVDQNAEDVVDAVRRGKVMRSAISVSTPTVFACFIMLVRYCGMDEGHMEDFIGEFTKLAPDNDTVTALKMILVKSLSKNGHRADSKWVLGTILDGYTHFCEEDGSTMLNKQKLRLSQYQKYMDSTRLMRSNTNEEEAQR